MYKYKDIAFRVIEKSDLETLRILHNNPATWENLLMIDFVDENNQLEWWQNLHKRDNDKRFIVCIEDKAEEIIGRLRIQNVSFQHSNCEVGLDIIPKYRGKGYGHKSYKMVLKFLFEEYNMNMVYLKVSDFNTNAKHLYEKVGFIETGRLPKFFFRHGQYWDYIIMSITKHDYFD